jgi:DNA-binding CsgD family transcriptional regulator
VLQITPWERIALQLLADGETTNDIAARFDMSDVEVEVHLSTLFARMGDPETTTLQKMTERALAHGVAATVSSPRRSAAAIASARFAAPILAKSVARRTSISFSLIQRQLATSFVSLPSASN